MSIKYHEKMCINHDLALTVHIKYSHFTTRRTLLWTLANLLI